MRIVIQRVSSAVVSVNQLCIAHIDKGLLLLAAVEEADTQDDITWLASKIVQMRIFSDENGKMNLSVKDTQGDLLLVSQFTLFASTAKGNRPSFIRSASPVHAIPLLDKLKQEIITLLGKGIQTGEFGADMKVSLVNDGPVTILLDSKNRE